ncbi:hypothetical protein EJF18_50405 [Clavispora lusitaniae]|uniref:Uncharacterized protein n=1 Tax=Clavispora lusitaniae TaxID=36911 RepID=A0ACD0WPM1_CLALS|nr:hypothetical protein EJF14_50405 [Clavispora lusitaniae]QFZ34839.1 hypothetical protein EJF16_50405 [Clavispora lusitaniae]QFZ40524.1 hypothetical protein EJF15_50405 [Clavispora lusitaniae]QFZ46204.1 hypothetical protein EJF18_50405 [Clavispora lusitaniae]QFZ51866.1 hypothetical protein EJF17_50405 [Clavispora lusitaniae]
MWRGVHTATGCVWLTRGKIAQNSCSKMRKLWANICLGHRKHAQIVQTKAAEACSNKIVLVIFYSGWCQPSSLLGCMLSKTTLGNLIFFCRSWHHLVEISGTSGLHKTIGEKEMQKEKRNDVYSVGKTGCVSPTLSPFKIVCPCVSPWFLYFVVVAPSPLLTFSFFVEYFHARTA